MLHRLKHMTMTAPEFGPRHIDTIFIGYRGRRTEWTKLNCDGHCKGAPTSLDVTDSTVDGSMVTLENLECVMLYKLKCGACIWPKEMTFLISLWKVTLKYALIMVTNKSASINEILTMFFLFVSSSH